jgi:uncharacterized protein (DUF1501 family)
MNRRNFLQVASATGLVIPYWGLVPIANAQSAGYQGKILVNIHASGGLDASSWADPRERDPAMNNYAAAGTPAGVAGNIRFAPMGNNAAFFARYFNQMLVINGVHSETNGHDDGTRAHATGRLDMGYPNISELFASVHGKGLPMPWMNSGGFSVSAGLVAPTPIPNANNWRALISPNSASATQDFIKEADILKTQAARAARVQAQIAAGASVPRSQLVAQQLGGASDSRALLARVAQFTPATFDTIAQAHVGLIAAQAGICSTIQLSSGGFDGHSQLANSYAQALPRLTDMVDYVMQKSAALGLSDRILLRIYSEFGRTPINSGNGKDHWAVGTQILMEAAPAWGNRVFGASGPKHEQLKINPATGAVDPVNGIVMRPRHIHEQLRRYLGIQTNDPKFALKVPAAEMFDFFNPALSTGYPNL